MLSEKQQKNLQFLRDMPDIFIPSEFTYWCHSTMYKPEKDWCSIRDKRNWTEIPTESFSINKDMSFVTKVQRLQTAVDFNKTPDITYANTENSLPFQIRIVQPRRISLKKLKEDGFISEDEFKKKMWNNNGLGDYRHPKLPKGTKIYIFGSTEKDEISGQKIDIVYGIAEEDIDIFVAKMLREYSSSCQEDANYCVVDGRVEEQNKPTIILKSENRSRLKDLSETEKAEYKIEYENSVRQKTC